MPLPRAQHFLLLRLLQNEADFLKGKAPEKYLALTIGRYGEANLSLIHALHRKSFIEIASHTAPGTRRIQLTKKGREIAKSL